MHLGRAGTEGLTGSEHLPDAAASGRRLEGAMRWEGVRYLRRVGSGVADAAIAAWRAVRPLVLWMSAFFLGCAAGSELAVIALGLPHYPLLGVLTVASAGGAAYWFRRRGWLCALLVGIAASGASTWVVLLLGSRALSDF